MKKINWLQFSALVLLLALTQVLSAKVIDNYLCDGFPVLVPTVQKLEKTSGTYSLPKEMKVSYPGQAEHEFQVLAQGVSGRFGSIKVLPAAGTEADCKLVLTEEGVPESTQGYTLSVSKEGITIKARTTQGLFYGVNTLNNLVSKNLTTHLPCCEITDYPSLELRGVYYDISRVNLNARELEQFIRWMDNLGKLKINFMEIDFGSNLPLKDNPFTDNKSPLTESDVKKLIDAAKRNYIEIMPHLQILSHEAWLRCHPEYLTKITSRRTKPGAQGAWATCTCPNSKLAREVCDLTIKETIRIFNPKRFNLSLDEFENCMWENCQFCGKNGHTAEDIVRESIHYVNLVKSFGVIPYVYQDAMLPERCNNSVLADPLRKAMPREAGVAVWDYTAVPVREHMLRFKNEGFKERLAVSFGSTLTNAMTMPIAAKETGCQGCILTYWGWAGAFYANPKTINCNAAASTVINAEFCWNADIKNDFRKASWDPAREYAILDKSWRVPERRHGYKFAPVPLAEACNGQFGSDDCFPKLDKKIAEKIASEAKRTIEGFQVNLTPEGKIAAIMLSGGNDNYGKKPVSIPVNNKVKGLSFLLAGGIPEDAGMYDYYHHRVMPAAFTLRVNYADGTKKTAKVCYRLHFNNWNSESSGALSRFAVRCNEKRGFACSFYSYDWNNPLPQQKIVSIELIPNLKKFPASSGADRRKTPAYTGVPTAVLALTAWAPGEPFAAGSKINAALPEAAGTEGRNLINPNTALTFKDGMPKNLRFSTSGKFTGKVTKSVVDTPQGKMLKIELPPSEKGSSIPRIMLDISMTPPEAIGAVFFNCRVSEPDSVSRYGAYLMNKPITKYRSGFLKKHHRPVKGSTLFVVPAKSITTEPAHPEPLPPEETDAMRLSIWFNILDKPLTVYIGEAGTALQVPRWVALVNESVVE